MKISTHTLTTNICQIFIFLADETSKSLTRIKNIPISCNLRFFKQNCDLNVNVNLRRLTVVKSVVNRQ